MRALHDPSGCGHASLLHAMRAACWVGCSKIRPSRMPARTCCTLVTSPLREVMMEARRPHRVDMHRCNGIHVRVRSACNIGQMDHYRGQHHVHGCGCAMINAENGPTCECPLLFNCAPSYPLLSKNIHPFVKCMLRSLAAWCWHITELAPDRSRHTHTAVRRSSHR